MLRPLSLKNRAAWSLFLLIALAIWAVPGAIHSAYGQADKDEAAEAEEKKDGEADPASEEDPPPDEGEKKKKDGEKTEGAPTKNVLIWLIETSGWIGAVLLVLSIYFVATVIKLFMELKEDIAAPPEIINQCNAALQRRDFMGLYKVVREDASFFSTVLAAGVAELPLGLPEARETMDRAGDAVVADMEKKISMLAVLGTLGPMIGLLGTLKGMISSFSVIALSDTQLKSSEVAGGISEALLLTFEGVGLSVPAIYFFAVFRNRVSTIAANTMLRADEYLRKLHAIARKGGGAPQAAE